MEASKFCAARRSVSAQAFIVDDDDRSICRNRPYFEALFSLAGATVARYALQSTTEGHPEAFPADIYPVRTWALRWPAANAPAAAGLVMPGLRRQPESASDSDEGAE